MQILRIWLCSSQFKAVFIQPAAFIQELCMSCFFITSLTGLCVMQTFWWPSVVVFCIRMLDSYFISDTSSMFIAHHTLCMSSSNECLIFSEIIVDGWSTSPEFGKLTFNVAVLKLINKDFRFSLRSVLQKQNWNTLKFQSWILILSPKFELVQHFSLLTIPPGPSVIMDKQINAHHCPVHLHGVLSPVSLNESPGEWAWKSRDQV